MTSRAEQQLGAGAAGRGAVATVLSLDRVVHEPARLAILTVLTGAREVDFTFLLSVTGLTRGNLGAHLGKLEETGYVSVRKTFRGRVPATFYRLTGDGRAAFQRYGHQIQDLSHDLPGGGSSRH